jgi:hypothetical protein
MCVFVGTQVCVFVGTQVCVFVGTQVCVFVGTQVCVFVGTQVRVFVGTQVCVFVDMFILGLSEGLSYLFPLAWMWLRLWYSLFSALRASFSLWYSLANCSNTL